MDDPAQVKQRLAKIEQIHRTKKWKNVQRKHNGIVYMQYANLAINQSYEFHKTTC